MFIYNKIFIRGVGKEPDQCHVLHFANKRECFDDFYLSFHIRVKIQFRKPAELYLYLCCKRNSKLHHGLEHYGLMGVEIA